MPLIVRDFSSSLTHLRAAAKICAFRSSTEALSVKLYSLTVLEPKSNVPFVLAWSN